MTPEWPDTEVRIDIIGSNGNDGDHYGVIDEKPEASTGCADASRVRGAQAGQLGDMVIGQSGNGLSLHGHDRWIHRRFGSDRTFE